MRVIDENYEILHPDLSGWRCEPAEILLSPIDSVMPSCYTNALYVFKNPDLSEDFMPFELLKESLKVALSHFPDFCYRLERQPDTGDCVLNPENVGCRLVTASADFTVADLEAKNFDPIQLPGELLDGSPADCGQFCIKVKLTRLADSSVAVGAYLHHNVTDGDGAFTFINHWAATCRELRLDRQLPRLELSRDRSVLFSNKGVPSWDHGEYAYSEPVETPASTVKAPAPTNQPISAASAPKFTARVFHLGADFLRGLKDSVNKSNSESTVVCTTNDCLVALLWRCITLAKHLPEATTTAFGLACNARRRLSLPGGYAGNANFYISRRLTVAEIVGSSLPELARQVRAAVDRGSQPEYLRSILCWLESKADKRRIQPGFRMFSPDLAITSWLHFPIYSADFGWGAPYRFAIPSKGFDGLVVVLPRWDDDGCELMLGAQVEVMERLSGMQQFLKPF